MLGLVKQVYYRQTRIKVGHLLLRERLRRTHDYGGRNPDSDIMTRLPDKQKHKDLERNLSGYARTFLPSCSDFL